MRFAISLVVVCWMLSFNTALAVEMSDILPRPHYDAEESDPEWLKLGTQMHGHLGPWMTTGMRLGAAGRKAVGAEGYFDVRVTCKGPFDGPPRSCFIDGLQLSTGATLGKGNLICEQAENIRVVVENTVSGKKMVLEPTPQLLKKIESLPKQPVDSKESHEHMHLVEQLAREIAAMKDAELFNSK